MLYVKRAKISMNIIGIFSVVQIMSFKKILLLNYWNDKIHLTEVLEIQSVQRINVLSYINQHGKCIYAWSILVLKIELLIIPYGDIFLYWYFV